MQGLVAGLNFSDRFTLIRQLGRGGMGEIWLADDAQLAESVALKLLDPRFSQAAGFVDLLRAECRRARALVHPNIVRVFDFHHSDDRYFISMQYVDGDTLASLRGARFQQVVQKSLMVCDALAYAHRAGLIHRDVKTSNVLLDRNGVCYLSDFGIAAATLETQPRGGGSLPSMSPQQLAGQPAAVADDVYAFGALLYELLSGVPLFHPDVTSERIRAELPASLSVDGAGQELPESLAKLLLAMLDKVPERRPAGIGAVRSVLEEIHADYPLIASSAATDDIIAPVSRRGSLQSPKAGSEPPSLRRIEPTGKGLAPGLVYGGLAALAAVALVVIFLLPEAVEERRATAAREVAEDTVVRPAEPEEVVDPVGLKVQREITDEILGELLVIEDRLKALGVDAWGGESWTEARRLAEAGDTVYRARNYSEASTQYRQALNLMKLLEPEAAGILADALSEGLAAIDAGDQAGAIAKFELALAIEPVNADARSGLARAQQLDQVLKLTLDAAELESAGDLMAAAASYESALAIDPRWVPAREGLARSRGGIAQIGYETRMAEGFSAMAREKFAAARTAFEAALRIRPGDADAGQALRALEAEAQLAQVISLQARAREAEGRENWSGAVATYDAILKLEPGLISAQQNRARAVERQALSEQLENVLGKTDQFNDDRVAGRARTVLNQARAVQNPGPVHERQIVQLDEALRIAAEPASVVFQSDNLTEVVIYKVGSLGLFLTRTVDLKPGRYVAVGSRAGYRDVRRNFNVRPKGVGNPEPIILSCEEPI